MTGTSRAHLTPWWPLKSGRSATTSPAVGSSPTCGHRPAWDGCRSVSCVCCVDSLAGWGGNEWQRSGNERAMSGAVASGALAYDCKRCRRRIPKSSERCSAFAGPKGLCRTAKRPFSRHRCVRKDPCSARIGLRLSGYNSSVCLQSPWCASQQLGSRIVMCVTAIQTSRLKQACS